MIDCRYYNTRIALLLVEAVELLEEIYLRPRGGLDRVEPLQTRLEAEPLSQQPTKGQGQTSSASAIQLSETSALVVRAPPGRHMRSSERASGMGRMDGTEGATARTSVSVTKGMFQPWGGTILHMP